MSTSLPMLMPTQVSGSGESSPLPVNTAIDDSQQAFASVLDAHLQPDSGGVADPNVLPMLSMQDPALMPLLSVSSSDGQNLPLDLSQLEANDGNGLPFSPELMWSGMLIVNDGDGSGPQLYQLSEDGQSLTSQIDPNMQAQINRAMNRFAPLSNADMPGMLTIAGQQADSPTSGLKEQSMLFTATGTTPGMEAMLGQKISELKQGTADLNLASLTGQSGDGVQGLSDSNGVSGSGTNALGALALGSTNDRGADRMSGFAQLQMSGDPKNPAWAQGLGERMQWLVQQDFQGAEIRLNPPELGAMEVKLKLSNEHGAQIHFSSPNGAVREAIEAAIPRLREMFAESGLTLGDVNVSHQSLAEQQQNDSGERESGNGSSGGIAAVDAVMGDESSTSRRLVSDGLVDMYV